ncbi:MAG: hypothetical protein ACREDQ_12740, partial [Limisphaerales bacterium]
MGIKHGEALAVFKVLPDEIEQQSAFAGASCTDDVTVVNTLLRCEPDRNGLARVFVLAKQQAFALPHNPRRGLSLGGLPQECRGTNGARRDMHKAGQLVAVQHHSRASALAAQYILNMILERVIVIVERDEFVAIGLREHAQLTGKVARQLQYPIKFSGADED